MSGSFPGVAWEQKDTHSTHGTYHLPVRRVAQSRRAALTLTTDCLRLVGGSYSYLAMHFTLYGNGGQTTPSVISDILIVITGILQIGSLSCEYDSHLRYFGNHHHGNRFSLFHYYIWTLGEGLVTW